jgi:hypothetical protein
MSEDVGVSGNTYENEANRNNESQSSPDKFDSMEFTLRDNGGGMHAQQ